MQKEPAVYILANRKNGTLYTGVTSHLVQRIYQHKNNCIEGFSQQYQTHLLVYFELHETMYAAITRERQIKKWRRAWKINLIIARNPRWEDLYYSLL